MTDQRNEPAARSDVDGEATEATRPEQDANDEQFRAPDESQPQPEGVTAPATHEDGPGDQAQPAPDQFAQPDPDEPQTDEPRMDEPRTEQAEEGQTAGLEASQSMPDEPADPADVDDTPAPGGATRDDGTGQPAAEESSEGAVDLGDEDRTAIHDRRPAEEPAPVAAVDEPAAALADEPAPEATDETAPTVEEQRHADDDPDASNATPAAAAAVGTAAVGATAVAASRHDDSDLYRSDDEAPFQPEASSESVAAEEQKLAAERARRRETREAALAATGPEAEAPEPVVVTRRNTDKFLGSVGLFLLRIVTAAVMGIHGLGIMMDIPAAQEAFRQARIPEPNTLAIVTGAGCLAVALGLLFGVLTRIAGLGTTLIAAGALAFVYWGNWSPIVPGRSEFLGERELLLAAIGLLFLCVGAGGWSIDRSFRRSRERAKADRLAE